MDADKYTHRIKPVTRRNENRVITCPICSEGIEITESESFYQHIVKSHEDLTAQVIKLFDGSDNPGYDLHMLKCEKDKLESDRYWRS